MERAGRRPHRQLPICDARLPFGVAEVFLLIVRWEIQFVPTEQILAVRITGTVKRGESDAMLKEAIQEAASHSCERFLLDYREAQALISVVDVYDRPASYGRLEIPRTARLAVLQSSDFTHGRFAEDVAHNRGYQLRFFDSPEPAIEWLSS